MAYDPDKHHRRGIRLPDYDYSSPGAYFVTICTHQREGIFGEIVDGQTELSDFGRIADACWRAIPDHFEFVVPDVHVVMPNHVHGIVVIADRGRDHRVRHEDVARPVAIAPRGSLSAIIGAYKSIVARKINQQRGTPGGVVWQSRFYDHIVRSEEDLIRIREYIVNNPAHWLEDENHPSVCSLPNSSVTSNHRVGTRQCLVPTFLGESGVSEVETS